MNFENEFELQNAVFLVKVNWQKLKVKAISNKTIYLKRVKKSVNFQKQKTRSETKIHFDDSYLEIIFEDTKTMNIVSHESFTTLSAIITEKDEKKVKKKKLN